MATQYPFMRTLGLYRKYVGDGPVDLCRLQECIKRECRAAEKGLIVVSRGLLKELRAERAEIGRIINSRAGGWN